MAYIKLTKEDWRQKYNMKREKFMQKYDLRAPQVAPRLTKEDVRGMSITQIKKMSSLFTKPMAKTQTLESGEKISQSGVLFQHHLIEGNINPVRAQRWEKIKGEEFYAEGLAMGPTEWQAHMDRFKEFRPLSPKDYKSLAEAQRHQKKLKHKIYDPVKDERFKESFLKAIYRSAMDEQDKLDIAAAIKEMSGDEVAKLAMTHDEFDIAYVYSEVIAASATRAERLKEYLGVTGHAEAGAITKQEQAYYEGLTNRYGKVYHDKKGNQILGYDVNKVYQKIHGIKKPKV